MKTKKHITVPVRTDWHEEMCGWADRFGVTHGVFGALCIQIGLTHLVASAIPGPRGKPDTESLNRIMGQFEYDASGYVHLLGAIFGVRREKVCGTLDEIEAAVKHALDRGLNYYPRERAVISQRFGLLYGKPPQDLKSVGDSMSVTRERVRQVEAKALRRLRLPPFSNPLRRFIVDAPSD